ncbi:hypothetical protein [Lactobacillus delbrueckii]|uniref:hypothetical protein n=1 Tax=Lactobacillus delbrueckii TaxID=1584 RepID=UPI001E356AC0|nr:hypothetical protein [Lactobacillus delbrueckii]MCD5536950.1 hypothetical protein [Lactobacillus delbrueckii subsp. lactis]
MVNTILKAADLFCPNSVRINFTIYQDLKLEDVENGDLVHVGDEDYTKEQMEAAEEVVAKWASEKS